MTRKVAERRRGLHNDLVNIAEAKIAENGVASLRARDLATEAGCAVGAIYNVFSDLNDLVLAVNERTFHALGERVATALSDAPSKPTDQLIVIAQAYHQFAASHHNLWRAIFDLGHTRHEAIPDWYFAETDRLLSFIQVPLTKLNPNMTDHDLKLLTKATFSSVHGIVLLGLGDAEAGAPPDNIDAMISVTFRQLTSSKPLW